MATTTKARRVSVRNPLGISNIPFSPLSGCSFRPAFVVRRRRVKLRVGGWARERNMSAWVEGRADARSEVNLIRRIGTCGPAGRLNPRKRAQLNAYRCKGGVKRHKVWYYLLSYPKFNYDNKYGVSVRPSQVTGTIVPRISSREHVSPAISRGGLRWILHRRRVWN